MGKTRRYKMFRRTWAYYILLLFSIILLTSSLTFGEESNGLQQFSPINPRYKWVNGSLQLSVSTPSGQIQAEEAGSVQPMLGYRPPLIDTSYLENIKTEPGSGILSTDPLPASYDLRKLGKLNPVRDQKNCGACWTFATYGSMESCLLPAETRDFSENNLKNTHGFDWGWDFGGNAYISMAYLTRWSGPINESQDPYNDSSGYSPPSSTLTVQKHVQDVIQLPDRNSDQIKEALMTYGAVCTSMTAYSSNDPFFSKIYNSTYYAYWDYITNDWSTGEGLNHMVTIVGWDDNFSRTKFKSSPSGYPAGDGAWIVRNSWGTVFGDKGYFYISYYDNNFARELFVFHNAESVDNYKTKYEYDTYGHVRDFGGTSSYWMGNVFSALNNEPLAAVATYAMVPNTSYTIRIYTNVTGASPLSSTLATTQTGTFATAGYHTVKLNTPVLLTSGQKFSVVMKLTTPNYNYPIPIEANIPGFSSKATSNYGESYVSPDGVTWTDGMQYTGSTLYSFNACIKAYTMKLSIPVITQQPVSQTVDAGANPTFTVKATNTSELSYQWYHDDMPIVDGTDATLSLTKVSPEDNGEYYVTVANEWGSTTSNKVTLTVRPLLPTPRVDLASGTYTSPQNVSVFYPDGYTSVTLRYTTNGTDPTATSSIFSPTTPIKISTSMTLKVRAFKTGYTPSQVASAVYSITGTVAKPVISLTSGTYVGQQWVRLSCTTPLAAIYYTLDGDEPTEASMLYDPTKPIPITDNTTLKARAFLKNWECSATATATYILTQLASPTFSVAPGVFSTAQTVTIKSSTSGATVYYTTDGSDPIPPVPGPVHGKKFTTAISIAKDCTMKAIAYKSGLSPSEIASADYYIGTAPAPKFSLVSGGTYDQDAMLVLSDSISADIYYTTDGSTPTDKSTLYDSDQPIQLTKNVTIKARAYSAIRMPSAVVTATYNVRLPSRPEFDITGGAYTDEQTVTITYEEPGTVIRYTTNGTEPIATSSAIASGQAIQVKGPLTTLKAKAFKNGWSPSVTTTAIYKITTVGTVATPKLSPDGISPLPSLPYAVIVNCTTAGAVLRYTDNGTTPNGLSPLVEDNIIPLTEPKTIKVRAFKDGMASSTVVSATYTCVLPDLTLPDMPTNNEQTVTIIPITPIDGVTIRYTTDGTEPTAASRIAVNGQVLINKTLTLKAKAFKSGWIAGKTLTQKFIITQVASPTFSVGSGTYQKSQAVVVKCATVPATGKIVVIHYTLDGTDPTATSSPTCAPGATVSIPVKNEDKTVTLKALAVESGLSDSNISTTTYHMTGTVATPTLYCVSKNILQASGTYASGLRVYAKCATEGAEIHYTTDGTTPTLSSPLITDDYILVEASCKLNVKAFKTDWLPSIVVSETYTILQVATPTISIADDVARISCATPGAVIHYTIDGNEPTQSDPTVTANTEIPVTSDTVLKAKAWKSGLVASQIATAKTEYTLTVTTDGNGTVTPSTPTTVNQGVSTTISATPNAGYHFLKWQKTAGTGTVVFGNSSQANTTVTITGGDATIEATFDSSSNPSGSTIYTAGAYYDGTKTVPCYWTGTTRTSLPAGSSNGSDDSNIVRSICVSGGVVYTAGSYYDGTKEVPCYWRGTTRTDLPGGSGTDTNAATSICVVGGVVYTAGAYYNGTKEIPCYWVGTTRTDLPGGSDEFDNIAYSISVVGGVVYTAGRYNNGGANIPCYWAGTSRYDLQYGTGDGCAYSIYVSNGIIYTSGDINNGTTPCYWTGTIRTDLPGGSGEFENYAGSIYVVNGNVYTAGFYYDGIKSVPCYWTGTTRTDLPGGSSDGTDTYNSAVSICVENGTVYTSGGYYDGAKGVPCYWTGTTRTDLPGGSSGINYAAAIYVEATSVHDPYTLTVTTDGNGTVTPAGSVTVSDGSSTTITAIPNTGYSFVNWEQTGGSGTAVFTDANLAQTSVTATGGNVTIRANFTAIHTGSTIYTAGFYFDGTKNVPCYWKGTSRVALPGGSSNGPDADSPYNAASSICIYNGVVYTAGCYYDGTKIVPCYWVGTTRTNLPAGSGGGAVMGIYVLDGVVYTSGCYSDGTKTMACYWEGTSRIDLPCGSMSSDDNIAYSIFVSNGTVYTAGSYHGGDNGFTRTIPCYWIGTVKTDLPGGSGATYAHSIYVANGTIYTCGSYDDGTVSTPCYWIGTSRTNLPVVSSGEDGDAEAIFVANGSIYTAGYYYNGTTYIPCYWAGTNRTDLPGGTGTGDNSGAIVRSIYVAGGTIYTAGAYYNGTTYIPCYWTGTTRTNLPGGASGMSVAAGIWVE